MKHNVDTIKRSFNVNAAFALAEVVAFEKELREKWNPRYNNIVKEILGK